MSYMNNSGQVGYNPYRVCIVPECNNSSVKTPEKLWIRVPTDLDMRRNWLNLASRDPEMLLLSKSHVYFCEDHFDPNIQSAVSLEQSTMSNLLSPTKAEDYGLRGDVMETAPNPTLFCICCLEREVPLVSLLTCSHANFLKNLMIPEIKPQNQVICYHCHEKLKKITLFKLQVEESFKLLSDSIENTPKSSKQRHNLQIRQVHKIDIPQTNFNNIENPQTILEDANTDLDVIIKEEKEIFDNTENSLPANSLQTKKTVHKDAKTDLDVLIKQEKEVFDNTEKSLPANSLQTKKMKNIEAAIRIINNNQNSDCITFLATSLQSLSHSLLSDIYTNFDLGSQNDTNPNEILINDGTAPSSNDTVKTNSTENVTNNLINKNLNTIAKKEIMNGETINIMITENADLVENVANEELNQSVTEKNESMDVGESNNMQMDETLIANSKRPSPVSNIKQLTLTREQLMKERAKMATSQCYLRAPHRCESCLVGFQFQENLEDHVKRKHTSGKQNTVECDVCLQYVDFGARNTHSLWHHTRYECVACAEKFASYDKAAVHYRKNHQHVRSSVIFKCPHCPYKTGRKSSLTDHLKTKCKSCGVMLGCAMGNKLKFHMRNCVGAKLKTAKRKAVSRVKKDKVTPTTGPTLKNMQRVI